MGYLDTPLETVEQQSLAYRLRANNYMFFKVPSETFTRSKTQKKKNTLEGVCKGFPDTTIILKRGGLLFIELKRAKKSLSSVSKEQKIWMSELNKLENIQAEICYGCMEAIETIERIEKS